jgi:hypothetical protein
MDQLLLLLQIKVKVIVASEASLNSTELAWAPTHLSVCYLYKSIEFFCVNGLSEKHLLNGPGAFAIANWSQVDCCKWSFAPKKRACLSTNSFKYVLSIYVYKVLLCPRPLRKTSFKWTSCFCYCKLKSSKLLRVKMRSIAESLLEHQFIQVCIICICLQSPIVSTALSKKLLLNGPAAFVIAN